MSPEELNRRALETVYNELAKSARSLQIVVGEDIHHEESILVAREAHARILRMLDEINEAHTSNLVRHARRELEIVGEDPEFIERYLDIIRVFAAQGHSGGSASVFIPTLNDLLQFKPLTPVTDDPIEWIEVGEKMWQNTRYSAAFTSDPTFKTYWSVDDKILKEDDTRIIYDTKHVMGK